jgi:AraC-like DNA-binding protein
VRILTVLRLSWDTCNAQVSPRHFHALSFRCKGDSCFTTEEETMRPKTGDTILVPKNVGYHLTASEEEVIVIHFQTESFIPPRLELFTAEADDRVRSLFNTCYDVWSKKEPGYYFRALSIFYEILARFSGALPARPQDEKYHKLKPAINRLQENFRDPALSVKSLAQEIYVSEVYFRRLFADVFGTTPMKYIICRRILYAKDLLKTGIYPVETVAEMSGFTNAKHFSTTFKQQTGLSPSKYMREHA